MINREKAGLGFGILHFTDEVVLSQIWTQIDAPNQNVGDALNMLEWRRNVRTIEGCSA